MTIPEQIDKRTPDAWRGGSGVGPGWFNLLERLDADIAALVPDYEVHQAKQKCGMLRFYYDVPASTPVNVRIRVASLVAQAEDESMLTCEECGKPGRERTQGWIRTLCDEHASA